MKRIVCLSALSVALLGLAVVKPWAVGEELPRPARPGGKLGVPLGEYLTIEGMRLDDGKVDTRTLLVDTIGGKKLATPIPIWVENLELPAKKRCVLKGYENGQMIGIPPAEYAAAKERGETRGVAQAAWQWRPYFVALIVAEPQELVIPRRQ